jgi:hypothetical protein
MKKISIEVIKFICRIAFAYAVILLFAVNFNPLEWSNAEKIWLVIIAFILLIND